MRSYCSKVLKNFCSFKMAHSTTFPPNKPPTVFVYAEKKNFACLEKNLLKCLPSDKYIIYPLTSVDMNSNLWKDSASLLVISSDILDGEINNTFLQFVESGGKLLAFCSNLLVPNLVLEEHRSEECIITINYENRCNVAAYRGKYSYSSTGSKILSYDGDGKSVIYKTELKDGVCIISEVHLAIEPGAFEGDYIPIDEENEKRLNILKNILFEHFQFQETSSPHSIPSLTPGYVMTDNDETLNTLMENLKIEEIPIVNLSNDEELSDAKSVPLVPYNLDSLKLSFDKKIYFSKLKTEKFGQHLLYFPVIHTTMIAELFPHCDGLIVVAGQQLTGQGRSGTKWISREGCAMFTLHITVPLSSNLGNHISILQHISALSVVHGIRSLEGYDELNVRIKWPNDLYYGKECKIGGILVDTKIQGDFAHAFVGIAINVSNSQPTTCLNDIIKSYNTSNNKSLKPLQIEEVIAYTLNYIEYFINDFNKLGPELFLSLYYSYWLHMKQRIELSSLKEEAIIIGINEFGFLVVETDGGKKCALNPDVNSFSVVRNLVSLK